MGRKKEISLPYELYVDMYDMLMDITTSKDKYSDKVYQTANAVLQTMAGIEQLPKE